MVKPFAAVKMSIVLILMLSVVAGCGTGGLSDAPATGTTPGTTPTNGKGTITFTTVKASDPAISTTAISPDSPAILKATAKDSTGAVLAGKVITFSSKFDIRLSPASGTALTDATGTAAITIMVGATVGAATITASVSDDAGAVITNETGITVNLQAPPPVPAGVTATLAAQSQISLTWTASAGAAGYKIYKNGTLLGAVTTTSIVDGGLNPNTQYCYNIAATDLSGNESARSSTVCGTTGGSTGFVNLLTSSPQVGSDGLSTVTLTAIVKTANNVALKDKLVTFAADSGTLVVTRGTTDASGSATATLSAAADKSIRTIKVTATADSITSEASSVDVVGTTLQITGQTSLVLGTAAKLSLFLKDSAGQTIPYRAIALTSSLGNRFDKSTVSTSANGQAEVTYTAAVGGTDTVTASALGATTTQTVSVSSTDFTFTAPSPGAEVNIGGEPATPNIRIHYALSGIPQTGKTVIFSTTRGTLTTTKGATTFTANTDGSGDASAYLWSSTAGPAIITATIAGVGTIQAPVEFVATTAASISLQASPGTISTNNAGSTVEQSTIIAVLRDASGNLVKNKTVRFNLTDVSGGYIKQASDVTNSQGMASTTYISSISPSVKNGVRINATIDGSAATAFTTLTVASKPIYIVFGTGNTIENFSATQYRAPFSALVTDIAGNPQAGVTVTANLTPLTYLKGNYTGCSLPADTYWVWNPVVNGGTYLECVNEDNNPSYAAGNPDWLLNGILNSGGGQTEDINGDGVLTPGNVAEVNRTATTDANGFAQFYVVYAKQFANWVKVRIEGKIYSYGDQTLGTTQFYLPVLRDDVKCQITPPGSISPFGLGAPPNNVCTTGKPSDAKPPTGVVPMAISPTQIQVTWADAGAGVKAYRIYQDGIQIQDSVTRSIVSPGLRANATYCYAVSSLDSAGVESAKSDTVCTTTQSAGPPTPTGLTATGSGNPLKVTLAWSVSAGAQNYRIYRNGGVTPVLSVSAPAVTAVDSANLLPQTGYCYTISALDASGNESAQSSQVCTSTGLPAPAEITATLLTGPLIRLNWSAVAGAVSYRVYRDGVATALWAAGTAVTDTTVAANSRYCYTVVAVDVLSNESAESTRVCATTP